MLLAKRVITGALLFAFSGAGWADRMQDAFDELDRETGIPVSSSVPQAERPLTDRAATGSSGVETAENKGFSLGNYPAANIKNNTDYKVFGKVIYASSSCTDDFFSVLPHKKWTAPSDRGWCLIKEINAQFVSKDFNPAATLKKAQQNLFDAMKEVPRMGRSMKPQALHGELLEITKYVSEPATGYADFRIDHIGDRYRIYSHQEYIGLYVNKRETSPGFKLINKTSWPIAYSLDQAGCIYHDIVPATFNGKPGQVKVETEAVWYTLRLNIQPDGLDPQTSWDCVQPVVEIIGDVVFSVVTGGAMTVVKAGVKTGAKIAVKEVTKEAVESGVQTAAKGLAKNMVG